MLVVKTQETAAHTFVVRRWVALSKALSTLHNCAACARGALYATERVGSYLPRLSLIARPERPQGVWAASTGNKEATSF